MPLDHSPLRDRITVLERAAKAAGSYEVEVSNPTEYARHVAARDGVDVFDGAHLAERAGENVGAVAAEPTSVSSRRLTLALDKAGHENVAHLRGLTDATTDDGRRKHPTGYADVTGQLAGAYEHEARKL